MDRKRFNTKHILHILTWSVPLVFVVTLLFMTLGVSQGFTQVPTTCEEFPRLSGAIFTTTVDGAIVNENVHYNKKEDVYLDGGPGPNAPPTAAGLPAGDYYFQVTDPPGKKLLSQDDISCRRIHINEHGVIDIVYPCTCTQKIRGKLESTTCKHEEGVDVDHSELGAITVQLMPYDDTPNKGGVYKAWITPVVCYDPNKGVHGFIHSFSKTDNYKVKRNGHCDVPTMDVIKFHDRNVDGEWGLGEEEILGWQIDITDPEGAPQTEHTRVVGVLTPVSGTYIVSEEWEIEQTGAIPTVTKLNGNNVSIYPNASAIVEVPVLDECGGEFNEVIFGNVGLGSIEACKVYDANGNGEVDEGEPDIEGWKMELNGTDIRGYPVGPIVQETGADGCTTFEDLLPGTYTVTELIPTTANWNPTGPTSFSVTIESSLEGPTHVKFTFTNYCYGTADFDTKGYWHNKNGLEEITGSDIIYVNGLAPYSSPSPYFDDGDEPFDGYFADGTTCVSAAYNDDDVFWAACTSWAEISHFLVDPNAGASEHYHLEQLAQQLLAFIFNAKHRLDSLDAIIGLPGPDGYPVSAAEWIEEAIESWTGIPSDPEDPPLDPAVMGELLDALNNNDAVPYIHAVPCAVEY